MIIYLPLLLALVGGVIYIVTNRPTADPSIRELARLTFWVGLLAFLLHGAYVVVAK